MTAKHLTRTKAGKAFLSLIVLTLLAQRPGRREHGAQADVHGGRGMKSLLSKLATALRAAAVFVVVAIIVIPGLFGLQRYVITGGR